MAMAGPTSARWHLALLQAWHAWIAGGFLVAYLTADEDAYAMHQFAGYAVLAAIVLRLAGGLFFAPPSPLSLPRPSWRAARQWLATRKGRHPLFAWFAAGLLLVIGLAALSGALADGISQLEHPHEAIAEFSLWLIVGHIILVIWMHGVRKWLARLDARVPATPKESVR
jgi:cytochrome b